MKTVFFLFIIFSLNAFSGAPKGDDFSKKKAESIANIDRGIAMMNQLKSCLIAAANNEALKACHVKTRADRKETK